jgi:hypothetical protein
MMKPVGTARITITFITSITAATPMVRERSGGYGSELAHNRMLIPEAHENEYSEDSAITVKEVMVTIGKKPVQTNFRDR